MRLLLATLLFALCQCTSAQYPLSFRFNYAFIENRPVLTPLEGTYRVEYLARGQWWSYMDPRSPVDYPGQQRTLTPNLLVNGTPLMVVEMEHDLGTTDNKLRVVRGTDTLIVDLNTYGGLEDRMLARMTKIGAPPRPPVLVPFRKGWFTNEELTDEPAITAQTEHFDSLWMAQRTKVQELYNTERHTFSLESNGLSNEPIVVHIQRDPNYAHHQLQFPASGPGTRFELYRQDSLGVANDVCALRVDMPAKGETSKWVDITELPYGKYTAYLRWGELESLFYLVFGW